MRHGTQVGEDARILHSLAVSGKQCLFHLAGYHQYQCIALLARFHIARCGYKAGNKMSVMAVRHRARSLGRHRCGAFVKCMRLGCLERAVDIQTESGHYIKVVPEFTAVFGRIALNREECGHRIDYGICAGRTLLSVFDCKTVVDHVLYVPAVLRKHKLLEMVIIC